MGQWVNAKYGIVLVHGLVRQQDERGHVIKGLCGHCQVLLEIYSSEIQAKEVLNRFKNFLEKRINKDAIFEMPKFD